MCNFRVICQRNAHRDVWLFKCRTDYISDGAVRIEVCTIPAERPVSCTLQRNSRIDFLIAQTAVHAERIVKLVPRQSGNREAVHSRLGSTIGRGTWYCGVQNVGPEWFINDNSKGQLIGILILKAAANDIEILGNIACIATTAHVGAVNRRRDAAKAEFETVAIFEQNADVLARTIQSPRVQRGCAAQQGRHCDYSIRHL